MAKKLLFVSALLLFFVASAALAGNYGNFKNADQQVTLGADEVINRDYFAAGKMVEISGTVNGDVYAAGGEILMDGTVNGDLLVAAGNVTISGKVTQDIRVVGGDVTISGEAGRNITAVGGNITFTNSSSIAGNLVSAGGNLRLAGPISGNVKLAGGTAILSGEVGGFVHARCDMLRLTSNASVGDSLVYWSYQEASIDNGAQITGEVTYHPVERPEFNKDDALKFMAGIQAFTKLVGLISALVIGFLLLSYYPRFSQKATDMIRKRFWASFGTGLLFLVVVPVVFGLLLVTVAGIKLAFILLAVYFVAVAVANVFSIMFIGNWFLQLFSNELKPGVALLVGAIIFYLLTMIPVFGGVIALTSLFIGLGAMLLAKKEYYKDLKEHKLI